MNDTVVAVVVTFNRKGLLVRCIDALINQSCPLTRIIIIDNASTDGTSTLLGTNGYLNNAKIDYRILEANIGGAGGFNLGVAAALSFAPEQIWLMDDDGWPELTCLAELLSVPGDVRGPMIIDDQDGSKTSFGYIANGVTSKEVALLSEYPSLTPVHPFNGVLLSAKLITKIGLPDSRFFIWGDEVDYRNRWLAAGYVEKSNSRARFFHPSDRQVISKSNKKSLGIPLQCSRLRKYCFYRNQTNLTKRRSGLLKAFAKVLFTIPDVFKLEPDKKLFAIAVYHGLFGIFGRHTQFLK